VAVLLDTDPVPVELRAGSVVEAMARASAPCRISHLCAESAVRARLDLIPLGPTAEILRHDGSPMWMSRRAEHLASAPADRLSVGIPQTGGGAWMQHGHSHPMLAGELVLIDLTAAYDLRLGDGHRSAFQIDLADLDISVDRVRAASGRLASSPLYGLVRDHPRLLCRDAEAMAVTTAVDAVRAATADLVAALIQTSTDGDTPSRRAALNEQLLARAMHYVRNHLADTDLDLAQVAAAHGVAAGPLASAWSALGCEFAEWMQRERLAAARRQLLAADRSKRRP
jgi:hypothetical protein